MIHTFKTKNTAWLSNMYLVSHGVELKDRTYTSVEAAYQSEKSHSIQWKDFCQQSDPYKIKKESHTIQVREDWHNIKLEVMEFLLRQKFKEGILKELLIQTGDQNIQEGNTWGDRFWGVDIRSSPNIGENHLGRLIMKIRGELLA